MLYCVAWLGVSSVSAGLRYFRRYGAARAANGHAEVRSTADSPNNASLGSCFLVIDVPALSRFDLAEAMAHTQL